MPFEFHAALRLTRLTGRTARSLDELMEHLKEAHEASVFDHTYGRYLRCGMRPLAFNSDFGEWVSRAVRNQEAAAELGEIKPWDYATLDELRGALVDALQSSGSRPRECAPGDEFQLCASEVLVLPTGIVASDPKDMGVKLGACPESVIFHHFFEARLRLDKPWNDFSAWLDSLGEQRLAEEIEEIDRDTLTVTQIRKELRRRLTE